MGGAAVVSTPDRIAVAFAATLRRAGVDVPVGAVVTFTEAVGAVGVDSRFGVYWSGRATLVRRPEDAKTYDRVFAAFWLGREAITVPASPVEETVLEVPDEGETGDDAGADGPEPGEDGDATTVRYSATEILRHRDFAAYTHAEHDEARRLMNDVRLAGSLRRSRRLRPTHRRTGRPDVRATVAASLRTDGEAVRRSYLAPSTRPRRVVLLCDVSGSMEPYARALVRFVHSAVAGAGRVEAFALGTRLTRITRELSSRDPDAALAAAGRTVPDWSGGTRLGPALRAFNDEWGMRGMARGAVVVILSDGWDRGDPEQLGEEMARLHRVAHKVVWVNPLKATAGYAPLARGMAAALPHVDDFVEGHSLAALERLAEVIAS